MTQDRRTSNGPSAVIESNGSSVRPRAWLTLSLLPSRTAAGLEPTPTTGSPVALNFGGPVPVALGTFGARITRMIARRHAGDRRAAEAEAVERLQRLLPQGAPQRTAALPTAARVLGEIALLGAAMQVSDPKRLTLLRHMAALKPRDLLGYQRALLAYLGQG